MTDALWCFWLSISFLQQELVKKRYVILPDILPGDVMKEVSS
jgi:hypothetical protein